MIIKCLRCGKEIDTPDNSKADYIVAEDTVVKEPREVLIALTHNAATLAKRAKIIADSTITLDSGEKVEPSEDFIRNQFEEDEFDQTEIPRVEAAGPLGAVKVITKVKQKDIQKTGIICPECYRDTDFVIWGVHKKVEV